MNKKNIEETTTSDKDVKSKEMTLDTQSELNRESEITTFKFKRTMSSTGFVISMIIFILVCIALYIYFYK